MAPATFLKDLRDENIWSFAESDVGEAVSRNRELDAHLGKTAALLAASLKAKDDRYVFPISEYARQALIDRLREYPRWVGADWTALSPEDAAIRVAGAVAAKFGDTKEGREARSVFFIALMLLSRAGLESAAAARALARAFDARIEPSARWEGERVRFIGMPRSKLPELRALTQTLVPWIERVDSLSDAVERASASAEAEKASREKAEDEVRVQSARIAELEREAGTLRGRIRALEDELRASQVHGKHQADQTRSSVRGLLEGRVGSFLTAAAEALELEPPRTHIALEQLQAARDAIQEHIK